MRRIIPFLNLFTFVAFHYILTWPQVPAQNHIPATLGASAFTAMSASMLLAARIPLLDHLMNGPGRSYRLHRWLAYWAVVTTVGHWATATPHGKGVIPAWADFAGQSGEYAAIVLLLMIAAAMLQFIPYHFWKLSHHLMGPIYLVVVFHTFFTPIPVVTGGVLWWLLIALATTGSLAYLRTIIRHFIPAAIYRVAAIHPMKRGVDIRLVPMANGKNLVWQPGQFALLSCDRAGLREPHPFTISSAPGSSEIRFLIGNNGDFTSRLIDQLQVNDLINISEVSGEFNPNIEASRPHSQIWVAGGIGISPFLAAIAALKPDRGPQINLFYCYRSLEYAIDIEVLIAHAERLPQLVVHFLGEGENAIFDDKTFPTCLSAGWKQAELFICGPTPLIDNVCSAYRFHNGQNKVHAELFEFRDSFKVLKKRGANRSHIQTRQLASSKPLFGIQTFGV